MGKGITLRHCLKEQVVSVSKWVLGEEHPETLFLMNDPFALAQTKLLSKRLIGLDPDDAGRIRSAYRLLYGRPPTAADPIHSQRFGTRFANG